MKLAGEQIEGLLAGVILAGGRSERFGAPKRHARLAGERLVDRAVRLVRHFTDLIVVVLPAGEEWDGVPVHAAVSGGDSRTESMRQAMTALPQGVETVLVNDVIRPLATARVIERLLAAIADGADGAMPVWPLPDTLKKLHDDGSITHAGREGFVVAQGPTAFRAATLRRMFEELGDIPIEETIGIERIGGRVAAVPGDRWSQHVLEPRDLVMMERLVELFEPEEGNDDRGSEKAQM
jgi:2-C-methyl-D-erythritol 4-phosphate cytidylyltransferase